jgi:ATP synthase protein I
MARQPHPSEQFRSVARIYQLTGEFVAPIVVGLLVDYFAKTAPWGIVVGVLCGMLIGGVRVAQLAAKIGPPPKTPPDSNEQAGPP